MQNLKTFVENGIRNRVDRVVIVYAVTAAMNALIDSGLDPRVAISKVRNAVGSENIHANLRDVVDIYVVVNCIDGRQYTLDRLYQVNPATSRVDTAGAVEVRLCLKPLNAPAWAQALDDFYFATYWMY